jgi:hypothetical protein
MKQVPSETKEMCSDLWNILYKSGKHIDKTNLIV